MSFTSNLPKSLSSEIEKIIKKCPESLPVFEQLYAHISQDLSSKKRKVSPAVKEEQHEHNARIKEEERMQDISFDITKIEPSTVVFQLSDISFQSPFRKKLSFVIAISPTTQSPYLAVTKKLEDQPEFILNDLRPSNFKLVSLLSFPEKKNQMYLVFFYLQNYKSKFNNEPLVITLNIDVLSKQLGDKLVNTDLKTYLQRQLSLCKIKLTDFTISSFFVEAYQKSKEGVLYFLPNHIIFGFKKPILLFESSNIDSITYSNITRVTFNVTLVLKNGDNFEFGMIDQLHFDKIDTYIKNKNVNDMSMSAELKAKKSKGQQDDEDNSSHLAELAADQDDDDDEEEDETFQAGDESVASGSSSGSEEDSDDSGEADLSESLVGSGSDDSDSAEEDEDNNEESNHK